MNTVVNRFVKPLLRHFLFVFLIGISTTAIAQTSPQAAALPVILCLILCEDGPVETLPDLADITDPIRLFVGVAADPVIFENTGGSAITACNTSPELPSGLILRARAGGSSCEIIGTPNSATPSVIYSISATNAEGTDSAQVTIEILTAILITGTVTYDLVPTATNGVRLDYANIRQEPVRAATVQLLNASNSVIDSTVTSETGTYQFALESDQSVRVRVRAELLKNTGNGRYNVTVVDNTNGGALYTLAEMNLRSAIANPSRNLNAASGWGTSSYTGVRASAPFAMLDSIYGAISDVLAVDSGAVMNPLTVNWSVNNRPISGALSEGNIGTSFYSADNLFILGAANNDTDEFDDHIIIHEWGHYFEDNLSRSDSIGGPHTGNDRLDMRVAFGEGFGNALSGIVTDDPLYIDTNGFSQASGFSINVESNPSGVSRGWYNESSVQSILYDLYDSDDDGSDTVSLGFAPLYNVLVNQQRNSPFFTSIFTLISAIKEANPSDTNAINQLVSAQNIVADTISPDGATETNNANTANVLPVYSSLLVGTSTNVCTITNFNGSGRNKLSNNRYLTFSINTSGSYSIQAQRTSAIGVGGNPYGDSDPDFVVQRNGLTVTRAESSIINNETDTVNLSVGDYVMAIYDWNIGLGRRGTACFDISVSLEN